MRVLRKLSYWRKLLFVSLYKKCIFCCRLARCWLLGRRTPIWRGIRTSAARPGSRPSSTWPWTTRRCCVRWSSSISSRWSVSVPRKGPHLYSLVRLHFPTTRRYVVGEQQKILHGSSITAALCACFIICRLLCLQPPGLTRSLYGRQVSFRSLKSLLTRALTSLAFLWSAKCVFFYSPTVKKVPLPKYGRFLLHITINHAPKSRFSRLMRF